jgi:hypothetical protein
MRAALLVAVLFALWGASACSVVTSHSPFEDAPPPPLQVRFDPQPLKDGTIARDATVLAIFDDDFPDPDSATFGPVLLRSGAINLDADIRVDLLARAIRVRPRQPMQTGATYELVLSTQVGSLGGRSLAAPVAFPFLVGPSLTPIDSQPPVAWSDVASLLQSTPPPDDSCFSTRKPPPQTGCAPFCHSRCGGSGRIRPPTRGLDLTGDIDPHDPTFGLINVPSVGLAGTDAELMRVLPGDSSRSVLFRKLLGGGAPRGPADMPYPDTRVDGKQMPLGPDVLTPTDDFNQALPDPQLHLIQRWIDEGAHIP